MYLPAIRWPAFGGRQARLTWVSVVQEKAFTQKYPRRLPSEWRQKTQKYKKEDEDRCYQVPLGHLVHPHTDNLIPVACARTACLCQLVCHLLLVSPVKCHS